MENSQNIQEQDISVKSVYVISEYLMFGYGLENLLQQESTNIKIIGCAKNLEQAVEQVKHLQPDLIILYSHTPLSTGTVLAKQILELNSTVNLISISVDDNTMYTYQVTQYTIDGLDDLVKAIL